MEIVGQIHGLGHIRAHQFVGQAVTETGEGLSQKEQTRIISMFKSGQYNVLVATCIAEEGLDIGNQVRS
jgi:ERCC4-related helicase